jgi:hypothetical protein
MGYKRSDLPSSGGDYLKARTFNEVFDGEKRVRLVISDVDLQHFDARGEQAANDKLILSFQGRDEKLPLNITNAEILFEELAEDSDGWIGGAVYLYVGNTKKGPGIKVKVPENQPERAPREEVQEDFGDDGEDWD